MCCCICTVELIPMISVRRRSKSHLAASADSQHAYDADWVMTGHIVNGECTAYTRSLTIMYRPNRHIATTQTWPVQLILMPCLLSFSHLRFFRLLLLLSYSLGLPVSYVCVGANVGRNSNWEQGWKTLGF